MNLYEYKLDIHDNLVCRKHEGFKEKDKTYSRKDGYPRRIYKDTIDIVNDSWEIVLWVLEQDDEKAKAMMTDYYQDLITLTRGNCDQNCAKYSRIIHKMR